jgi:hypothetical protein
VGNGDIPHFAVTNGDGRGAGGRAFRGLTRSAPSRSRALQERKWGQAPLPRCAGKWGQTSSAFAELTSSAERSDPICFGIGACPHFLSWRWLVGSLRALTSAEMAALRGNAAARSGFLLAALHSVAERVNPRKARRPAPHCPRVLAKRGKSTFAAAGRRAHVSATVTPQVCPRLLQRNEECPHFLTTFVAARK